MRRIARVFPRRTNATPTDDLAFVGSPGLFPAEADEVRISVAFSWDLRRAEELAREWAPIAPVTIGGPACGDRGGDFEPGQYLRHGYTITSRGCPNRCWFCDVPLREGDIRHLPIRDGHNILDSNLLACTEDHIRAVFAMLARQPERARFTGGLEAARLEPWHVDLLSDLRPRPDVYLAFDGPEDLGPLRRATAMLWDAGFTQASHRVRCYVLIGYPRDTMDAAETRLLETIRLGLFPMAMLYRDRQGDTVPEWRRFQREWARPHVIGVAAREERQRLRRGAVIGR